MQLTTSIICRDVSLKCTFLVLSLVVAITPSPGQVASALKTHGIFLGARRRDWCGCKTGQILNHFAVVSMAVPSVPRSAGRTLIMQ